MDKKKGQQKEAKQYFTPKKLWIGGICGLLLLFIAFSIGRVTAPSQKVPQDNRTDAPAILAHQSLNKSFQFAIPSDQSSKFTYTIQSADIQNDVIIKGQRATAVKGKRFLIINLKLKNPTNKSVQMDSRDYIRLSENNSSDASAADIHNDPILIQPIATEYTRLGFTINDSDKTLVLHVGEIDGKKSDVKLRMAIRK